MKTRINESAVDWSSCTFEGAEMEALRRWSSLSFRSKLEAMQEMHDLAHRFLEIRKKQGLPYIDPHTGEVVRPPKA